MQARNLNSAGFATAAHFVDSMISTRVGERDEFAAIQAFQVRSVGVAVSIVFLRNELDNIIASFTAQRAEKFPEFRWKEWVRLRIVFDRDHIGYEY